MEKDMKLRKFIATTIREYLNEQQEVKNNLNDNFWKWFGNSIMVKGGNPNIFFHFSDESFNSFERKFGINTHLFSTEVVNREAFFLQQILILHHDLVVKNMRFI